MEQERKQGLVDQRALNVQTVVFVADREAEIATQAEALAREKPELGAVGAVAALERERRKTLMELALEEKRLATEIQMDTTPPEQVAALEREHRKDLLEIARAEERTAQALMAINSEDPTVKVLGEQAERNRDLLRHVARTQTDADRTLRE